MVRIMLVDENGDKTYLHCDPLRLGSHSNSTCTVLEKAVPKVELEIGEQLAQGHVHGWINGCRWYRQAGRASQASGRN
jgi:hypothetical protein